MNERNILRLYFVFAAGFFLAELFDLKWLTSICKLFLMPLVFLYYYTSTQKVNIVASLLMIFCFVGDIFLLFPYEKTLAYVISSFGVSHILFTYICFKSIRDLKVKRLIFSALPVIILWFVYYNYSLKDIFGEQLGDLYVYVLCYSITLSTFTIISLVNYFNEETKVNLYAVIVALTFVIGDVIMGLNMYITKMKFFELTNILAQVVGYFFILKFITEYNFKQLS